ncbi:MAG TPA: hypothetical protein VLM38_15800 [Blastocatellia bacterium]|nr:hypothetical protein [Blastocatellia bacterium]
MRSSILGISGAFVVTIFLFLLRHLYLTLWTTHKQPDHGPRRVIGDDGAASEPTRDEAWILMAPDQNLGSGSSKASNEEAAVQ